MAIQGEPALVRYQQVSIPIVRPDKMIEHNKWGKIMDLLMR